MKGEKMMENREHIYNIERRIENFKKNPKLIYNYDYMEEFMLIKNELEGRNESILLAYDNLYSYIVGLYKKYCEYYLSLDNMYNEEFDCKHINACILDYKNRHMPDNEILIALINDVIKELQQL